MSTWIVKFVLCNCAAICVLANLSITPCQAQDAGLAQSGANAESSAKGEDLASYVLKPQDVLSISFALTTEYNETVTVMTDGYINLQLVNALYVAGLTVAQATSAVKAAYRGVLPDSIVNIAVKK